MVAAERKSEEVWVGLCDSTQVSLVFPLLRYYCAVQYRTSFYSLNAWNTLVELQSNELLIVSCHLTNLLLD